MLLGSFEVDFRASSLVQSLSAFLVAVLHSVPSADISPRSLTGVWRRCILSYRILRSLARIVESRVRYESEQPREQYGKDAWNGVKIRCGAIRYEYEYECEYGYTVL